MAGQGEDNRKGYAFNNPDLNMYDGWGAIVTPDEIRDSFMFGIPLVSPDGHTITNPQIQMWIDHSIAMIERDLNINIKLTQYRYRMPLINQDRTDLVGVEGIDWQWEDPYDFNRQNFNNFIFLKLRHKPISKIYTIHFRDALGMLIADITSWCKPNYENGSLEFFPHSGALANMPLFAGSPFFVSQAPQAIDNYPNAFFIDYDAGFSSAEHLKAKWPELFQIVGMISAIFVMIEMGEGRISGIASTSLGLGEISESFSTTASAENSMLQAKIKSYQSVIKEFYRENKRKYGGLFLGAL